MGVVQNGPGSAYHGFLRSADNYTTFDASWEVIYGAITGVAIGLLLGGAAVGLVFATGVNMWWLAAAFAVPMSLLSESRCFVNLVPLIVPFVAKTVDERSWRPGQCWWFVGLCLLGSRCWLPQNLRYPELYFMNVGSFMTDWDYALQIVVCLALGYILYRIWSLAPKARGPALLRL